MFKMFKNISTHAHSYPKYKTEYVQYIMRYCFPVIQVSKLVLFIEANK